MEEWKEYKLGELYDVHNGLTKGGKFFGSGYPFLSFSTVFKNYFLPQELTNLVQSSEKEQSNFSINKGDVFITRTSESADELGMSSVALKDYPNATYNGFTKRLRPKGVVEIYPKYIGYYLRSPKFRYNFYGITSSMSTRASLSNGDLLNMIVILPPYATQQKIANILSSLDDKIEVNRRINEQLEELAGALFKSWFVDFEPFKDGEFVDSELGMIPKEWKVGTLDEVSKLIAGGDKPEIVSPNKTEETQYPIYSNGIDNYGLYGYTNNYRIAEESVTVSARGTIGYVCLREEPYTPIVRLISIIPNLKYVSAKFIYHSLKTKSIMGTGTTQQQLTVPMFRRTSIIVPPKNIVDSFTVKVNSMFDFRRKNQQEITHLTTLRDTLLPKLMSGEIDVNEVKI